MPVRVRLTAAFAVAMALVLVGAGLFVYERLRNDLDESVTAGLVVRAGAVVSAHAPAAGAAGEGEEGFAQLLGADGQVLAGAGDVRGGALRSAEVRRAQAGERVLVERPIPGIEGTTRVLATAGRGPEVVAVGQSLQDRDDTLGNLVRSFALGGPIAVLLASVLGYVLAAAGLRPVEAMRRRAREVSLSREDERLPLPAARDEIRRLGETLNEMLDRLSRSFERERRFVADASHELRTPVAVIKTELEGALRAGGHAPQVREALVVSVEECDHLAQLAEDLLILARSNEGQLPVRPESLELREQLERVARRFGDRAAERGRGISVDVGDDPSVYADELRLRQALGNLVDNALRYGRGEIVLRTRRAGSGLELEVADEGEGFTPAFVERAFERFARDDLARTRTRTRDGAGLGLSIVRAIAEAHGGRAEVIAGPGATVRIWLPDGPGARATFGQGPVTAGSVEPPVLAPSGVTAIRESRDMARSSTAAGSDSDARFGARALFAALAIVLVAVPFGLLLFLVEERWSPLSAVDGGARDELHTLALRHDALVTAMNVLSTIGSAAVYVPLFAAVAAWLVWHRLPRLALFVIVTTAGSALLNTVVKLAVDRARPVVADPVAHAGGMSFPSGHAQSATVAASVLLLVFLPLLRGAWRPAAVALAATFVIAIGLVRVTLGVHYVSDVLAGYALGAAWVAAMIAAFNAWRRERGRPPADPARGLEPRHSSRLGLDAPLQRDPAA